MQMNRKTVKYHCFNTFSKSNIKGNRICFCKCCNYPMSQLVYKRTDWNYNYNKKCQQIDRHLSLPQINLPKTKPVIYASLTLISFILFPFLIAFACSMPEVTRPKTVYTPFKWG